MSLQSLDVFQALKGKMDWLSQRQSIIARNISNSDTNGYQPVDLKKFDYKPSSFTLNPVAPAKTDNQHLSGTKQQDSAYKSNEMRKTYETAPAGNAVVLEEQMMIASNTAMDYQMITNIYQKNLGILKTAIGTNRG